MIGKLRAEDAAIELRRAVHHFVWFDRPRITPGSIASFRRRRDDLLARARLLEPELQELSEQLRDEIVDTRASVSASDALNADADMDEFCTEVRRNPGGLTADHLEELARSTIDPDLAREAGLFTETWLPLLGAMLRTQVPDDGSTWLVMPYFRAGQEHPAAYRVKRFTTGKTKRSYWQPTGVPTAIYFPPQTRRSGGLTDAARTLIWCEGEKKTLCVDRLGYVAVGLPGVWNAADSRCETEHRLHPWIREDVVVAGRRHVIAFDRDIATNPQVRFAATRLATMLAKAGATEVRLIDWSRDDSRLKGIDDVAYARGDAAVHELLAHATSLSADDLYLPATVMSDPTLTAAQKVGFAAVFSRARKDGVVVGATLAVLAGATARSRQAAGALVKKLVGTGRIQRSRGAAQLGREGWARAADRYRVQGYVALLAQAQYCIHRNDLGISDAAALVLAVLRRHGECGTAELAKSWRACRRGPPGRQLPRRETGSAAVMASSRWLTADTKRRKTGTE